MKGQHICICDVLLPVLHRSLGEKIARADGYTEMGELKGGRGGGLGCDDVDGSDA